MSLIRVKKQPRSKAEMKIQKIKMIEREVQQLQDDNCSGSKQTAWERDVVADLTLQMLNGL